MKHMKSKIAAVLSASVMAVSGAATLNASAVTQNGNTQYARLSGSSMPFYMHAEAGYKFPSGRYWNTGNPETCSTSFNGTTTYISAGQIKGIGYTDSYVGPGGSLSGSAGFARKLAVDYFGTDHFIRQSGAGINFKPKPGDQIAIGSYNSNGTMEVAQVAFVTYVNGNSFEFAYANQYNRCKISWSGSASIHNGAYLDENNQVHTILYVDRPMQAGDVNGDTTVDYSDYLAAIKVANGTFNYSGKNATFVRAAANVNCDGTVNSTDSSLIYSNYSNGILRNYGFITSV